jgi:hypothetical protein
MLAFLSAFYIVVTVAERYFDCWKLTMLRGFEGLNVLVSVWEHRRAGL